MDIGRREAIGTLAVPIIALAGGCTPADRKARIPAFEREAAAPPPAEPFKITDRAVRYQLGNTVIIEAIDLKIQPKIVSPEYDLAVFAYRIEVDGVLALPGRTVSLYAREIVFAPGSSIDVSGRDRSYSGLPPAAPGGSPDDAGDIGSDGGPGDAAGSILIAADRIEKPRLIAKGGDAGKGQDGGDGYDGQRGRPHEANGRTTSYPSSPSDCTFGEPGGDGESCSAGGGGGRGGTGGAGGSIRLLVRERTAPADLVAIVDGGRPGQKGADGDGGYGGPGGTGGYNYKFVRDYSDNYDHVCEDGNPPKQPDGRDDNSHCGVIGANKPPALAGAPGKLAIEAGTPAAEIAKAANPSFVQLLVNRFELDYLAGDIERAAAGLLWCNDIAGLAIDKQPALKQVWQAKLYRTAVLLQQIRLCQNYFGFDQSYVPSLRPEAFDDAIKAMLASAVSLERTDDQLEHYKGQVAEFVAPIEQSIAAGDSRIAGLKQSLDGLRQDGAVQIAELQRINGLVLSLRERVGRAEASFKEAVRRKAQASGGCGFDQVLKAGSLITAVQTAATVFGGAMPSFAAAAALLRTFQPPADKDGIFDQLKHIYSAIDPAIADINGRITAVNTAYQRVQGAYDELTAVKAAPLILLDRSQYKQTLDEFRDLAPAAELRVLLDQYFDALDGRNQKVMQINANIAAASQAMVDIVELENSGNRLRTIRANVNIPGMAEFASLLKEDLIRQKRAISKIFALQNRAISYYRGSDVAMPPLNETRVAQLEQVYAGLKLAHLDAKQAKGQKSDEFEFSLSLKPSDFAVLASEGTIAFSIAPTNEADDFELRRWSGVELLRAWVEVSCPGGGLTKLRPVLVHLGTTSQKGTDNAFHPFSYKPRAANISCTLDPQSGLFRSPASGHGLGGGDDFIYLSPYGAWRLSFDPKLNPGFDPATVTGITVRFAARGVPTGFLQGLRQRLLG